MNRPIAIAAALAAFAAPLAASAADHDRGNTPCFFVTQWRGWKSPDPDTLYLGVNNRDVYKVTLSAPSNQLSWPEHAPRLDQSRLAAASARRSISISRSPTPTASPRR